MPLIPYPLHLLIPSSRNLFSAPGAAFTYFQGQDHVNFGKAENQSTYSQLHRRLG